MLISILLLSSKARSLFGNLTIHREKGISSSRLWETWKVSIGFLISKKKQISSCHLPITVCHNYYLYMRLLLNHFIKELFFFNYEKKINLLLLY